jgi:hypothetical protein
VTIAVSSGRSGDERGQRFAPSRWLASAMEKAAAPVGLEGTSGADGLASTGSGDAPTSPRRALILALAGLTAATEAASVAGWLPDLSVGDLEISISLLPALVMAVACGPRLLGRSTVRRAAAGYWIAAGILVPLLGIIYWRVGRMEWYPGLISAALGEELTYRLAIPAVIGAALRLGHVRPNTARVAGLALAGLWFILLPGHTEQMGSPAGAMPFIAFASLSAVVVYRSGSILPMAVGHAISNLLTVLMWQKALPTDYRSAGLACVLGLLLVAYGRPSRLTVGDEGELVDTRTGLTVTAIDLRDGQPAAVELTDGRVVPVHPDIVQPPNVLVRKPYDPQDDPVPPDLAGIAERARRVLGSRRRARLHHQA